MKVIKIGGNIIDDNSKSAIFLKDFAAIEGAKILVHGGGKIASEIGLKLAIEPKMFQGRRITDKETLDLVTMVYAGLINKNIVATLQSFSCNAIGLSGADANVLSAVKRPVKEVDFGFVGDLLETSVNTKTLQLLLNEGIIPVLSPITHDGNGTLLNTNADTIASTLAVALSKIFEVELIYCFEKKGVLENIEDENSLIKEISSNNYLQLKSAGIIADGMIPKIDNAFDAIRKGVKKVRIMDAMELKSLNAGERVGTEINN
jgi:acetylglutamate kinase